MHACTGVAMAGNIIPAIATTNAVIAGLIVMEALNVLAGEQHKCKTVSSIELVYSFMQAHMHACTAVATVAALYL